MYIFASQTNGKLHKYHVEGGLAWDYGKIFLGNIISMEISHNDQFVFIADAFGFLKEHVINDKTEGYIWGKIHDSMITSMQISQDSKILCTGDFNGCLKIWDIDKKVMIKDFGQVHQEKITSMQLIKDQSQNLYTGDLSGCMLKISVKDMKVVTSCLNLCKRKGILNMSKTENNQCLFISFEDGYLLQYNLRSESVIKNYGRIAKTGINSMIVV